MCRIPRRFASPPPVQIPKSPDLECDLCCIIFVEARNMATVGMHAVQLYLSSFSSSFSFSSSIFHKIAVPPSQTINKLVYCIPFHPCLSRSPRVEEKPRNERKNVTMEYMTVFRFTSRSQDPRSGLGNRGSVAFLCCTVGTFRITGPGQALLFPGWDCVCAWREQDRRCLMVLFIRRVIFMLGSPDKLEAPLPSLGPTRTALKPFPARMHV